MRQIVLRLSLLLLAPALLAPAAASAATTPDVRGVSAPRVVAAGARLPLTVKVRNAGRRPSRPARLQVLVSTDRRRDARDVALTGALRVPRLPARGTGPSAGR